MFGCIMSTRTRKTPCFEKSWRNGQMVRAVDGDEEVLYLDRSWFSPPANRLFGKPPHVCRISCALFDTVIALQHAGLLGGRNPWGSLS